MLFSFNAYDDKFIVFAYGILLKLQLLVILEIYYTLKYNKCITCRNGGRYGRIYRQIGKNVNCAIMCVSNEPCMIKE